MANTLTTATIQQLKTQEMLIQNEIDTANTKINFINHTEIPNFKRMWHAMYDKSTGKYLDPFTKADRTNEKDKRYKAIHAEKDRLERLISRKQSQLAKVQALIKKLEQGKKSNKATQSTIKSTPQRDALRKQNSSGKKSNKKKITEMKFSLDDQQNNKEIVDHAKRILASAGVSRSMFNNYPSLLSEWQLNSILGFEERHFDHYDKYTNTADIDFKKPITLSYFENGKGPFVMACANVTVFLNDKHEIDFSLPQNKELLEHKEIIGEILQQYPESFATIPVPVINKDPEFFADAFELGVNNHIENSKFGVDEQGNARDEAAYIADMQKMGAEKDQELETYQENLTTAPERHHY